MENFGRFIGDIRKEIKWIDLHFEEEPFGETMTIKVPPSKKKYVIDTNEIGKIEYNTPMYDEFLKMTLEYLNIMDYENIINYIIKSY